MRKVKKSPPAEGMFYKSLIWILLFYLLRVIFFINRTHIIHKVIITTVTGIPSNNPWLSMASLCDALVAGYRQQAKIPS